MMTSVVPVARRLMTALMCALLLLCSGGARALQDEGGETDSGKAAANSLVSPESPRVSLTKFLELCRLNRYEDAAAYLDFANVQDLDAATVARRLKAVLDHHVWFDLESISPDAEGELDDELADDIERIASIPGPNGGDEPVLLVRRETANGVQWIFTAGTVERVHTWYMSLDHRWALELLPAMLLKPGPGELLWWQWMALPILLVAAWVLGFILGRITSAFLSRLVAKTSGEWDDVILARLNGPLTLGWTVSVMYLGVPLLSLYKPAEELLYRVLGVGLFVVFFWALLRVVDVAGQYMLQTKWAVNHPASRSLIPLGGRLTKVVIMVMATIGVLSELGFPVASLVAGLGVGGLAFALAAKSTVENLFGAFAMGVDQPIRVGDFVRVDDFVGTVESIGMRSTRIRTQDRTTVSIPNGKIAEMKLETFATRDRMRLKTVLGVEYGATASQMQQMLEGCERVLRDHPHIWPDNVIVRFTEFGASSLDIEIMCWFEVPDYNAFRLCRQEVLLGFMEVVEKAGSSFAFPTRTVHLVTDTPLPGSSVTT
jgi:MscS family membrane protein